MALAPVSQMLLRHWPDAGRTGVLLNPAVDDLAAHLGSARAPVAVYTRDSRVRQQYDRICPTPSLRSLPEQGGLLSAEHRLFACMPQAQAALGLWLYWLAPQLCAGQALYLCGEKRSGVASAAARLGQQGWQVEKCDSARHCQMWRIEAGTACVQASDLAPFWQVFSLGEQSIYTLPGVFSHGSLDPGSRMLVDTFTSHPPAGRKVVDFGAGAGVLGLALLDSRAGEAVATLISIDADEVALWCAERSLAVFSQRLALQFSHSHEVDVDCDLLLSNPPFHVEARQDTAIAAQLIAQAAQRLSRGGELRLVANRFLPYPQWLQAQFGTFQVLAEDGRFRVYSARRSH